MEIKLEGRQNEGESLLEYQFFMYLRVYRFELNKCPFFIDICRLGVPFLMCGHA